MKIRPVSPGEAFERLMGGITMEPNTGCWIWAKGMTGTGYPVWNNPGIKEKNTSSVRRDILRFHGVHVPFDAPVICVCPHGGSNAWCVNPEHLRVGSMSEAGVRSNMNGRKKVTITPDQVRMVRRLRKGGMKLKELSRVTGVPYYTMTAVLYDGKWAWVDGESFPRADRYTPWNKGAA